VSAVIKRLRMERQRRKMSQAALGRVIGTSAPTLNMWENGRSTPTLPNLETWATTLGYELDLRKVGRSPKDKDRRAVYVRYEGLPEAFVGRRQLHVDFNSMTRSSGGHLEVRTVSTEPWKPREPVVAFDGDDLLWPGWVLGMLHYGKGVLVSVELDQGHGPYLGGWHDRVPSVG
jgi:transcriptional regulator with XRE-family HTH domain